jgi:hypothetical protein
MILRLTLDIQIVSPVYMCLVSSSLSSNSWGSNIEGCDGAVVVCVVRSLTFVAQIFGRQLVAILEHRRFFCVEVPLLTSSSFPRFRTESRSLFEIFIVRELSRILFQFEMRSVWNVAFRFTAILSVIDFLAARLHTLPVLPDSVVQRFSLVTNSLHVAGAKPVVLIEVHVVVSRFSPMAMMILKRSGCVGYF